MARAVDRIALGLRDAGVGRLFGMPGGGSIAELIEAAAEVGLPFTLAHTETAAAFMAAAHAEASGRPGVCLATLGPGAASLINGVSHAWLDRVPVIAITDCLSEPAAAVMLHQTLHHSALFGPITKWTVRLDPGRVDDQVASAVQIALEGPAGPVHLDLSTEAALAKSEPATQTSPSRSEWGTDTLPPDTARLLQGSRRPALLVGLGARRPAIAAAIQSLAERHGIPALLTYKAKGVVPDEHPWFAGLLTNGALERPILEAADLFLAVGLDAVELLARPWTLPQRVIHLSEWKTATGQLPAGASLVGDLTRLLDQVSGLLARPSAWNEPDVRQLAASAREAMREPGEPGRLWPYRVVELVAAERPDDRVTVDAGAHMFPALALWPVRRPLDLLISNGLSSMAFALPSAIGATLFDLRPTTVLTGDGGLLMCLAELRTAAQERLPLRIVVFDDQALSLIKIKQVQRGFRTEGVSLDGVDWVALGQSLGVPSRRAATESDLVDCLRETSGLDGPVLIAASVDPSPYGETMKALRG